MNTGKHLILIAIIVLVPSLRGQGGPLVQGPHTKADVQEIREIFRSLQDAVKARDLDKIIGLLAPEVTSSSYSCRCDPSPSTHQEAVQDIIGVDDYFKEDGAGCITKGVLTRLQFSEDGEAQLTISPLGENYPLGCVTLGFTKPASGKWRIHDLFFGAT